MIWFVISFVCGVILTLLIRKDRRSFITGSYAYGDNYRTSSSDVDLVLWVSEATMKELKPFCETIQSQRLDHYNTTVSAGRIKSGGVDLILVSRKRDYDHWRRVTTQLKKESARKALTRDGVIETFEKDRKSSMPLIGGPWKADKNPSYMSYE
jgi:hypothetical protein